MKRWGFFLTDTAKTRLDDETLEMGTLHTTDDGETMLVFRDRFVALRVASRVESEVRGLDLSTVPSGQRTTRAS